MAYQPEHLRLKCTVPGPVPFQEWVLDTVDVTGNVDGTDYITDAADKGMVVGAFVWVRIWTTAVPTSGAVSTAPADAGLYMVRAIDADGNATLSAETALTVAGG